MKKLLIKIVEFSLYCIVTFLINVFAIDFMNERYEWSDGWNLRITWRRK